MRGWEGALRRYSEPSRSLRGRKQVSNETQVGCPYHSPRQPGKEGKWVRKKEGTPHLSTGWRWPWLGVLVCVCPSRDTFGRTAVR